MANLYISEYGGFVFTSNGISDVVSEPANGNQVVAFTTSAQSAAFGANTRVIRVIADADAHLKFAANPTAVVTDMLLPANTPEYFAVQSGFKVAAYDGIT